jgi:hypothetical protein
VAGSKLWKNGIVQKRADGTDYPECYSVFVSDGDLYVAGPDYSTNTALLWKNGEKLVEHSWGNDEMRDAYSVYVSGSDVYLAGCGSQRAKLLKNGVEQNLELEGGDSGALSVYVYYNNVIVVGYERNASGKLVAKLWVDGVATNLSDGIYDAWSNSVYVSDGIIYAAGEQRYGQGTAMLWKNGRDHILGMREAYSVFVVE